MRRGSPALVLLLVVALASLPTWATQNATVTGTVYFGGAAVAGATVRLINASIAFSQSQITGDDGTYSFSNVPPAENYVISVEKSGFATQVLSGLVVQVNEEKLVVPPFLLQQAAQPSQPVAPAAPAAQPSQPAAPAAPAAPAPAAAKRAAPSVSLDLLSSTESGVLDTHFVHTLPLANRDFIDLALLVPGTYSTQQGAALQGASLVVNGARANMNDFLLDGTDNNDYTINQSLPFQIVEAMQEFRVQTSTSPAEFGRNGGAQINTISRRGTNSVHGTLFEFFRNSALSANNFFSGFNGGSFDNYTHSLNRFFTPAINTLSDPTLAALDNVHNPHLAQNQFGANLGGPLHKDKLFGFFNWESFRVANPLPVFEQVPGTSVRSASLCPAYVNQVFSSNPLFSPVLSCDPTAVALYNLYPAPNVPATPFTDPNALNTTLGAGVGAFNVGESRNSTSSDNFLGRVDWLVNSKSSMSFKHNVQRIDQIQGGAVPASATYPGSGTGVNGRSQNFSYNYVQQISSRTTNEFRSGWNRFRLTATALDASVNPASLGFQNLDFTDKGLPTVTVGTGFQGALSLLSTVGAGSATPSNRADNVWSWGDGLSLVRGRHTWKFGGEFRRIRLNVTNEAAGRGSIGLFTAPFAAGSAGFAAVGFPPGAPDLASIARVCPQTLPSFATLCTQFGNGFDRSFSTRSFDWYVQDQWRPWHNFTLNYGLRYEVNTAPVELRDRLVNFYPNLATISGKGGLVRANSTTILDPFGNVIGTAPGRAPRAGFDTDYNGWGPRFGFAWDPWNGGKTVVRGGYAIFFDQQPLEPSVNMLLNPPVLMQDQSLFPLFSLDSTFQNGTPAFFSPNGWFRLPYSITARDPNTRTPYVHQFNFGIEQRLGNLALFGAEYVGSAGHKLPRLRDISPCNQTLAAAEAPPGGFFNPLVCIPLTTNAQGNALDSSFLFPAILNQEGTTNSNFNSLQLRFEVRSFHGLQLNMFYQYAKSIDNASSLQPDVFLIQPALADFQAIFRGIHPQDIGSVNSISPTLSLQPVLPIITTRPNLPQDSSNLAGERGLSDFDIRHRFVFDYIYDVPRWAPGIGTGWQLAGITTVQSGQPFTVFEDFFGLPFRPNVTGRPAINNGNPGAAIDGGHFTCFPPPNTCPASSSSTFFINFDPRTGAFLPGNLGRNTFAGPGLLNFDFSILKNIHLGSEQRKLQFRTEFFNLFNRANFRQPYSRGGELVNFTPFGGGPFTFFDPFFGQILQARPPREIQFALRLDF